MSQEECHESMTGVSSRVQTSSDGDAQCTDGEAGSIKSRKTTKWLC